MNVHISRNAELFYKALEDMWSAEQVWYGNPNTAVWLCTQAAEKTMKGFLFSQNMDYDHGHELDILLDEVLNKYDVPKKISQLILFLNTFGNRLRYRNMLNDPLPEDAQLAISRTKQIMREFNSNPKISSYMDEAREVHLKIIKANYEKYSKIDISNDKPSR